MTKEEYLKLKRKHLTDKEICAEWYISPATLNVHKRKWRIKWNQIETLTKEQYLQLKQTGASDRQIAKRLQVTYQTVYTWKKKWGLVRGEIYS